LEPTGSNRTATVKHYPSGDYEARPTLSDSFPDYETIEAEYYTLEDPKQTATSLYENATKENTVSEMLSYDQLYEDPGHQREVIYSWFEKKKFRKIKEKDIRYAANYSAVYVYTDSSSRTKKSWGCLYLY